MILANYRLWRAYTMTTNLLSGDQSPNPNEVNLGTKSITGETSNKMTVSTRWSSQGTYENWSLMSNLSSRIGSGITDPTDTDYALSNDVTNQFSNIVRSFNAMADGNSFKIVHTITGTNTSSDTIIITEIGLSKNIMCSGYPNAAFVEFLFARSLLEQPIEVPPGRGFSLTFEWVES